MVNRISDHTTTTATATAVTAAASSTKHSSVESLLCRELNIRFIDARAIVTEAKLNLDIHGYVSTANQTVFNKLVEESIKVYNEKCTTKEKHHMKKLKVTLDTVIKRSSTNSSVARSASMSTTSDDELICSLDYDDDEPTVSTSSGVTDDDGSSSLWSMGSKRSRNSKSNKHKHCIKKDKKKGWQLFGSVVLATNKQK